DRAARWSRSLGKPELRARAAEQHPDPAGWIPSNIHQLRHSAPVKSLGVRREPVEVACYGANLLSRTALEDVDLVTPPLCCPDSVPGHRYGSVVVPSHPEQDAVSVPSHR